MPLSASDIYTHHRPSRCALRVYLRHRGELESVPGEYADVLRRLGRRHELAHLASLGDVVALDTGTRDERERLTRQAVADAREVIYQPALRAHTDIAGKRWEVIGDPDFLIRWGDGYIIRDCKIAHRITHKDHPEIHHQLELYGWLFWRTFGTAPAALEVYGGTGEIVELAYKGGGQALQELAAIADIWQAKEEPYEPVGWTKCGQCPFKYRCWPAAEKRKDVALVYGVDQWMVHELREDGVETYPKLVELFTEDRLARLTRPTATHTWRVGKRAPSVLRMARALTENREILIQPPAVPEHPNYVMFDLEGMPPQLQEPAKIYLWGLQVFGDRPTEFRYALSDFGTDGDHNGWLGFLELAGQVFEEYGDLPFVHWHSYEKTNLQLYVDRFGDPGGVGARVLGNLLDCLPIAQESIALPLPSYSLKVVEQYIGFERKLAETSGEWAMARYVEAVESQDELEREALMNMIVAYNREDLEAMWEVMQWLAAKGRPDLKLVRTEDAGETEAAP
jgi:predicted RecB family nuclease